MYHKHFYEPLHDQNFIVKFSKRSFEVIAGQPEAGFGYILRFFSMEVRNKNFKIFRPFEFRKDSTFEFSFSSVT